MSNGKGSEERRSPRQERDPRNRIPPPKLGPPDLRRSSRTVVFWLLLLLAAITVFNFLQTRRGQEQDIAYSHFREQLGRSNIRRVTFVERQVSGVLVHPDTVFVKGRAIEYTRFRTTLPFDDPALVNQLEAKKVEVEAKAPSMWGSFLLNSLPWIGIAIVWFFIFRQMQSGPKGVFTFGKSRARMVSEDKPRVTFADVAGADEAKEELQEIIEFLKDPQKFQRLGGKIPKGALLLGPPGTGKTLMARAIAGEAGVPFFSMSGSDFVEMFVGVGASRVRDLFDTGKHHAPCIIFIDELDAVGRHRGAGLGGGHDEREQTLNQLLVEMDGFESNEGVILLAATNRPDVLDPALLRPGRFDRQIVVDRPDINGREGILKVHTRKIPISEDVDLKILARGTPGFSGADLANMVNEAALLAARYNRKKVAMQDFESAKDRVLMGLERKSMLISEEERRNTAYHEAGHVLVSKMIPGSDPIHKVTIIPRGRALGVTQQLPVDEKHNYSRTYCLDKIAFILGGRAAELIVLDQLTTGSGNDIETATELARKMVCEWGMSEALGPITFGKKEEEIFLGREISKHRDYSEQTAVAIDAEVRRIVEEGHEKATRILKENVEKLHAIATNLLEREILDSEDIDRLMRGEKLEEKKKGEKVPA